MFMMLSRYLQYSTVSSSLDDTISICEEELCRRETDAARVICGTVQVQCSTEHTYSSHCKYHYLSVDKDIVNVSDQDRFTATLCLFSERRILLMTDDSDERNRDSAVSLLTLGSQGTSRAASKQAFPSARVGTVQYSTVQQVSVCTVMYGGTILAQELWGSFLISYFFFHPCLTSNGAAGSHPTIHAS